MAVAAMAAAAGAAAAAGGRGAPAGPLGAAAVRSLSIQGVHFCGPLPLHRLRARALEGARTYPEAVEREAERFWKAELARRPKLFDGPVWCLVTCRTLPSADGAAEEADGAAPEPTLELELALSSFKYVLYTHYSEGGLQLPADLRAGAVGLMALTETADGLWLFGRRSAALAAMPGYWHCMPAGTLDSTDSVQVLRKELHEEIGCPWERVADAQLLAVMDSGAEQGFKNELVFSLRLALTASELLQCYNSADDRDEHDQLLFVRVPRHAAGGPTTADAAAGPAAAPLGLPRVDLRDFLSGSYLVTDVLRRTIDLWLEVCQPAVAA